LNPAIKMVVHNYAWGGYPSAFFVRQIPTVVVTPEQAEMLNRDPQNQEYMEYAVVADNLKTAMEFVYKTTGTDKVIVFDGAMQGLNVSISLAEELKKEG